MKFYDSETGREIFPNAEVNIPIAMRPGDEISIGVLLTIDKIDWEHDKIYVRSPKLFNSRLGQTGATVENSPLRHSIYGDSSPP